MLSNLLTFSHTQQPITTIVYTHGKMGVNEIFRLRLGLRFAPISPFNAK